MSRGRRGNSSGNDGLGQAPTTDFEMGIDPARCLAGAGYDARAYGTFAARFGQELAP